MSSSFSIRRIAFFVALSFALFRRFVFFVASFVSSRRRVLRFVDDGIKKSAVTHFFPVSTGYMIIVLSTTFIFHCCQSPTWSRKQQMSGMTIFIKMTIFFNL